MFEKKIAMRKRERFEDVDFLY